MSSLPPVAAVSAVIVHHLLFRRYETNSFTVHASLLLLPPLSLAILYADGGPASESTLNVFRTALPFYLCALASSVLLYRLSPFHPLARYPGPLACRVSKFWMAFKSLSGNQNKYIKNLHDRHGDVVRIGPNDISVRDPTVIATILGPACLPHGPHHVGRMLSEKSIPMICIPNNQEHLQRRRPWARGLAPPVVKQYEGQMAVRIKQMLERLEEQHGEVFLDQWLGRMAYDYMSDMAFGGGSDLLSGQHREAYWAIIEGAMWVGMFFSHVPWLGIYVGHIPFAHSPIQKLMADCQKLAKKRVQQGTNRVDLFHYLNNEDMSVTEDAGNRPSIEQVIDDGILAVMAGSDTVANTLSSLFCCILTHPEVYEKLRAEVDRFYPPGEDVLNSNHYRDMHYLTAVINETLRLLPPLSTCSQRQVPQDSPGVTAGSTYLPPGTKIWSHVYSMQRDPRNFYPSPETFWPDRWLIASGLSDAPAGFVHNEAAFLPFSHGPMICVGKHLAQQEMRMVVCALIQRFRVRAGRECTMPAYLEGFRDYYVSTRGKVPALLEVRAA